MDNRHTATSPAPGNIPRPLPPGQSSYESRLATYLPYLTHLFRYLSYTYWMDTILPSHTDSYQPCWPASLPVPRYSSTRLAVCLSLHFLREGDWNLDELVKSLLFFFLNLSVRGCYITYGYLQSNYPRKQLCQVVCLSCSHSVFDRYHIYLRYLPTSMPRYSTYPRVWHVMISNLLSSYGPVSRIKHLTEWLPRYTYRSELFPVLEEFYQICR